jgi:hypothetical protein
MSTLSQEAEIMHNPGLGAVILWRFARGYVEAQAERRGPPLPLAFLVLPLVWHAGTFDELDRTREASGLRKFAAKFTESDGTRDVLLSIHDRAVRWRAKTHASLRMALASGLLGCGSDGCLTVMAKTNEGGSNPEVFAQCEAAGKLGQWFASLSLHEISLILHVEF